MTMSLVTHVEPAEDRVPFDEPYRLWRDVRRLGQRCPLGGVERRGYPSFMTRRTWS